MSNETTRQQILEAFHFRHACKQFDPERKISDEDFRVILEAARLSPSSFGLEPWKFIVLQNAEIRKKLLPFTWGGQGQIPTASHFVIVLARTAASLMPDSPYMQYEYLKKSKNCRKKLPRGSNNVSTTFWKMNSSFFTTNGCCSNGRAGKRILRWAT